MPNISKTGLAEINIGDNIEFTIKDYNDNVKYAGKVVAICDYETARSFEDVVAKHQSILAADPALDMDISIYRFLIIESFDGVRRPFAFDPVTGGSWFTGDAVELIEPNETYVITITGSNAEQANIALRILKQQGYSCSLSTKE